MRALILVAALGPCGGGKMAPTTVAPELPQFAPSSAGMATAQALHDRYVLKGTGCRRSLYRGSVKVCEGVLVPRGSSPCEQVASLVPGPNGEPQIETMFGSGCGSEKPVLAGPMGKELFFVQTQEQGFIVLCDGARVDHIEEFVQARRGCAVNDGSFKGPR